MFTKIISTLLYEYCHNVEGKKKVNNLLKFLLGLPWWLSNNLPAMQETQETWVQSLGREDPQEEGMATHSSMLAWKIPWTEEPGGLPSMGLQRVRYNCND